MPFPGWLHKEKKRKWILNLPTHLWFTNIYGIHRANNLQDNNILCRHSLKQMGVGRAQIQYQREKKEGEQLPPLMGIPVHPNADNGCRQSSCQWTWLVKSKMHVTSQLRSSHRDFPSGWLDNRAGTRSGVYGFSISDIIKNDRLNLYLRVQPYSMLK